MLITLMLLVLWMYLTRVLRARLRNSLPAQECRRPAWGLAEEQFTCPTVWVTGAPGVWLRSSLSAQQCG